MEFIHETRNRSYYFHSLSESDIDFIDFNKKEFILLIFVNNEDFNSEDSELLAHYLLDSNVRYILCAGTAAEKVHDLFDCLIRDGDWNTFRGETILTTGHTNEQTEDIIFSFVNCAYPEKSDPSIGLMLFPRKDKNAEKFIECLKTSRTN